MAFLPCTYLPQMYPFFLPYLQRSIQRQVLKSPHLFHLLTSVLYYTALHYQLLTYIVSQDWIAAHIPLSNTMNLSLPIFNLHFLCLQTENTHTLSFAASPETQCHRPTSSLPCAKRSNNLSNIKHAHQTYQLPFMFPPLTRNYLLVWLLDSF